MSGKTPNFCLSRAGSPSPEAVGKTWKRALVPLVRWLDRSGVADSSLPSPETEGTRFPFFPWDLRTLIAVFPASAPFRFLNLNVLLGMTGVNFDRPELWAGRNPRDAFDLQFCLEGRECLAQYKQYHSIAQELNYQPGAVSFQLGPRLRFSGAWPHYTIHYHQPELGLELTARFDSWPGFHWWAYFPRLYYHYTSFGDLSLEWKWAGREGNLTVPGLHDHGWGRNVLPLRLPLRLFRYEVLRLPAAGFAISLWTEGPAGLEMKNQAVHRPDRGPVRVLEHYHCQVLEWETFPNYAGEPRRVPRRWRGRQLGPDGEFHYEAVRVSPPRPIIGDGFLYAVDYQGEGKGVAAGPAAGEGYVEQMGSP